MLLFVVVYAVVGVVVAVAVAIAVLFSSTSESGPIWGVRQFRVY